MPAHGPGDAGGGEHLVKTIDVEHGVSVPLWRRGRSGDGREVGQVRCDAMEISDIAGFQAAQLVCEHRGLLGEL
jgi:hypothetical protein